MKRDLAYYFTLLTHLTAASLENPFYLNKTFTACGFIMHYFREANHIVTCAFLMEYLHCTRSGNISISEC